MASKRKSKPQATKSKGFDAVIEARARRAQRAPELKEEPDESNPEDEGVPDPLEGQADLQAGYLAWMGLQQLAREFAPNLPAKDLAHATELGHFLTRFLVGKGNPGDSERLRRMRDALLISDESRRAYAVQLIRSCLEGQWPQRSLLLWALANMVDGYFGAITDAELEALLSRRGKKGAAALAAVLALKCGAFGDTKLKTESEVDAVKRVARRFETAARVLTKSEY